MSVEEKFTAVAQPQVPEPIVAIGILSPPDTWEANTNIDMWSRHKDQRMSQAKIEGFGPLNTRKNCQALIAVTDHRIHAFAVKSKSFGRYQIIETIGDWARDDFIATAQVDELNGPFDFWIPSQNRRHQLDITMPFMGGMSERFLDATAPGWRQQSSKKWQTEPAVN